MKKICLLCAHWFLSGNDDDDDGMALAVVAAVAAIAADMDMIIELLKNDDA